MNSRDKENLLKEKLKYALESTARVISDDFNSIKSLNKNKDSKKNDFLNLEKINSKNDFIKARADSDSAALKKKFSIVKSLKKIHHQTLLVNLFTILQKK